MTASRLGETVGVSESTVVRFATELGFEGYPELQKALQEMIRSKLTSVQRMEVTSSRMGEDDILEKVLTSDMEMIRATLEQTSRADFHKAVDAINAARKIYILGVRSSAAIASFMAFYFNLVYDNVVLVDTASASEIFEQMFRIDERDVCIAISFPRYSKQTINALRFISDHYRQRLFPHCPICQISSGCAQRHGLLCGFARRAAELGQRPDRGCDAQPQGRGVGEFQ